MKNNKRIKRIMCVWTSLVLSATVFVTSAFATGSDPLTVVNNFSDFIFSCIKAVGIIILGWGIVQVGMSVQSQSAFGAGHRRLTGLPVPSRRTDNRVFKGNTCGYRCDVKSMKTALRIEARSLRHIIAL